MQGSRWGPRRSAAFEQWRIEFQLPSDVSHPDESCRRTHITSSRTAAAFHRASGREAGARRETKPHFPFQTIDPAGGSMGIFSSREDAERFIAGDPFTVEGLAVPRILEWNAVRFD